jgi:spore maturation protein CgeB
MRLMVIGSDKVYAIENFYVRYLRQAGIEIYHFCAQNFFYDYYQSGLVNKLLFKAGLSPILKQINKQFKEAVKEFKPEVIWVFKGMEIFPETLKWAKEKGIILINYNPDNPFIFTGKGSGNKNVTDSIGLYDLHFTYNLAIKKQLEAEYKTRTSFLPFGYDINGEELAACQAQEEVVKVCFLGNPDKQRANLITQIADQGVSVDLYGNNWNRFVDHKSINFFGPVYGVEFWKTLYRYRVQLNMMRVHNEDSHNMRTFEVPGVGAIQLAPDTTEHRMFFEPGKEIYLYKNISDCCVKVRSIMALTGEQASLMRKSAHNKSIQAGYTYRDRAQQVLLVINELVSG